MIEIKFVLIVIGLILLFNVSVVFIINDLHKRIKTCELLLGHKEKNH